MPSEPATVFITFSNPCQIIRNVSNDANPNLEKGVYNRPAYCATTLCK
jgi:hypothetical protein